MAEGSYRVGDVDDVGNQPASSATSSTVSHGHDHDLREESLGDLVKRLSAETSTLVKQEVDLAKAEMSQKAAHAKKGAIPLGVAAVLGLMALGALTAFLIMGLDTFLPGWVAALIVTVVLGGIAAFMAMKGKKELQAAVPPVPEQTVETVKEDVQWAKTQTLSAKK